MRAILKILGYLALVIVLVAVAYANGDQRVDLTWAPGRTIEQVPVFLVILGSIFIGVLIAGVIGAVEQRRNRLERREREREIAEMRKELRELRNLPISEGLRMDDDEDRFPSPGE